MTLNSARNSALLITLNLAAGVLLVAILVTAPACGEKKSKKADPEAVAQKALTGFVEAVAQKALTGFVDAATAHFKRNGDKFIKTDVLMFCRTGNMLHKGKLKPLGYTARKAEIGLSFCYNVHSSLKKVALSVATEEDESRWCVMLDGTSSTIQRGKMSKKKGCLP